MDFVPGRTANIDRGPSSNGISNYANTVVPVNAHITLESPCKPTERLDTLIRENETLVHDNRARQGQIDSLVHENWALKDCNNRRTRTRVACGKCYYLSRGQP